MHARFNPFWMNLSFIFIANFFASKCSTSIVAKTLVPKSVNRPRTITQIPATPFFSFPDGYQAENIAGRANGQILVTINTAPLLYQIDPTRQQSGGVAHTFHGYQSLFGIVELRPDVFYVVASNFTGGPDFFGFKGSASVFQVDLRGIKDPTVANGTARVSKILDVPQAELLDGFGVINRTAGLLISGDAQTGTLYLIDVYKGAVSATLQSELLKGTSNVRAAGLEHIGINGLEVYRNNLYLTNTAKGTLIEVPLDATTGTPSGQPSVIASYGTLLDDLSFDLEGNAFISEPLAGVLLRPANTSFIRNQTRLLASLPGANSNTFGRTSVDICFLYSTFDGAPSGVARIDLSGARLCNLKLI